MAFRPVQALASERTSLCPQTGRVDIERPQEALARRRQGELVAVVPQDVVPQQLAGQGDGEHAGQVVVARPGEAQFGHGGNRLLRESAKGLDSGGDVSAVKPEKPLASPSLGNDQTSGEEFGQMRAGGLRRHFGRHGQLRRRVPGTIQQNGEHPNSPGFPDQAGDAHGGIGMHTSICIEP